MKSTTAFPLLSIFCTLILINFPSIAQEDPLRILVIGAHPDDADIDTGGTAALWASMGHQVKFLSLTNGDAGHQSMGGGALAKRRRGEAQESARRLGIAEYEVLDNHDGELVPSLDVRLQVIRRIRQWKADVVILPRPNDYHPDHRNTGLVVQDAAYMVIVPNVASDTPPLEKNPVFLYSHDHFQTPTPFIPEIAVNIDPVFERKIDGLDAHVSQFYEWLPWTGRALDQVPKDLIQRKQWLASWRSRTINEATHKSLEKWYGTEAASEILHAETFQVCEYGSQPDEDRIRELFPMLGTHTPAAVAVHSSEPLSIDGKLDEPIYQKTPKLYLKNSISKERVEDPAYETSVQLVYDDSYLYVAFHCKDRDIYSSYTQRDEHLWKEEAVEVFIDTDAEKNNYVELEVSPNNVLFDSYIVDPVNIDVKATAAMDLTDIHTAVLVGGTTGDRADQDEFWTVEIAVPLKELMEDFHPDKLKRASWKINFYRINRDKSPLQYMAWSPTQGSFHQPDKFGRIIFR